MKFKKHVKKEIREILTRDLKDYEKHVTMTQKERKDLYNWVSNGYSPYDNDYYLYDEYGCPMDFISAERMTKDFIEHPENFACHYINDDIAFIPINKDSSDLPF